MGIFLLSLQEVIVPLLVKFLILLDMRLLALLSLLGLIEDKFLLLASVVLQLELSNPVLSHLCLDILALNLTGVSVLLEDLDEVLDVVLVRLLVQCRLLLVLLHLKMRNKNVII